MNKGFSETLIMIPAFNEEKKIGEVINKLISANFKNIVVIDDGSKDKTAIISKSLGAIVLRHPINIGVGGATSTGLKYAEQKKFDYVINVDGDGQHEIEDVKKVYSELIKNRHDIINGNRLLNMNKVNKVRFLGNHIMDIITAIFSGKYIMDTQCGLRGFNKKAVNLLDLKSSGYEISSEIIIKAMKNKLKLKSIPITAIYTEYSLKKGQKITNSLRIIEKLFMNT